MAKDNNGNKNGQVTVVLPNGQTKTPVVDLIVLDGKVVPDHTQAQGVKQ